MENKGVKLCMIIILILVSVILISVMVISIVERDKPHKVSFFGIGNHTKLLFENEYEIDEIESIKISTRSSNVKIKEGAVDKAKVTIYGLEDDVYNVNLNEKNLDIIKENNNYFIFALFYNAKEEVIVELPRDYVGNIRNKSFKWKCRYR